MTTEFIDIEMGLGFGLDDSDWGLFIILDEEEKKQTRMKYILQIETIEEGEYETEETYGEKIEYYNPNLRIEREQEEDYKEKDKEKDKDYTDDEDKDDEDSIKIKIKFAITYVLTTSFSIVLIILTFIV
jgi:hypothetical protein